MTNNQRSNYRERIFASYGKDFQDAPDIFDRIASRRWGKARHYHLRGWLPDNKQAHIVDLACGGGKLLHFFLDEGYQNIEGVDISPDQVALSRQVTPNITQGNVIEFLEAHLESFDLITGLDIVEHFNKDEALQFLDAIYMALKPNGRLILQTPNTGVPWGIQPHYGDFTHEIGFNPTSLRRLIKITKFQDIAVRECAPSPFGHSIFSSIRFVLWQFIRLKMIIRNLIETGGSGDRIFTRVFLITGIKKT